MRGRTILAERKPYDLKRHLPSVTFVVVALMALAAVAGAFVYTGIYSIGADAPHWSFVYNSLDTLRERSVARAARDIKAPADLDSPARLATGAGLYAEMCTGCHLGPGIEPSEMSQGLYPAAPAFASAGVDHPPAQLFWTIKHGIKLSAMPAWGKTHSDDLIWSMVAFVRKLPKMSPDQYQAALASAPADHDEMMEGVKGMDGMTPAHSDAGAAPHDHAPAEQHGD